MADDERVDRPGSGGRRAGQPAGRSTRDRSRASRSGHDAGRVGGRRTDRSHDQRTGGGATGSRDRRRATAPRVDDDVTGRELDKEVRRELATLGGSAAGTVARHLVMAGRLIDEDPERAHQHAQHARAMAGRVAVVREAAGQAAYEAGHYATALSEFRAARRISGRTDLLPVIADCERAVGRPDKAIELAAGAPADRLAPDGRAELAIVTAGALRDLGRPEEALACLEAAAPTPLSNAQWVARLQYARGDCLAVLGRTEEAVAAFAAADAGDRDGSLDAGARVMELLEP